MRVRPLILHAVRGVKADLVGWHKDRAELRLASVCSDLKRLQRWCSWPALSSSLLVRDEAADSSDSGTIHPTVHVSQRLKRWRVSHIAVQAAAELVCDALVRLLRVGFRKVPRSCTDGHIQLRQR